MNDFYTGIAFHRKCNSGFLFMKLSVIKSIRELFVLTLVGNLLFSFQGNKNFLLFVKIKTACCIADFNSFSIRNLLLFVLHHIFAHKNKFNACLAEDLIGNDKTSM